MADEVPISDFIDYNAFRDITAASERDLLTRQMGELDAATSEADRLLFEAGNDTRRAQLAETANGGSATTTLSSVGKYGDYLKAKQKAENLRALLQQRGTGTLGDVRGDLLKNEGFGDKANTTISGLEGREDAKGKWSEESLKGANRMAEEKKARDKKAADEKAARDAAFKEALKSYQDGVIKRLNDWHSSPSDMMDAGYTLQDLQRTGQQGYGLGSDVMKEGGLKMTKQELQTLAFRGTNYGAPTTQPQQQVDEDLKRRGQTPWYSGPRHSYP